MAIITTAIVVDDDLDTCQVFSEYLELKKVHVLAIGHNGKEAVDLYQKHDPDVVFLDVMMPEYDGFYGLKEIKKQDPDARVVMVTGDLTEETAYKLQTDNASAIVYKPFDIQQIMEIVENVVSKKHHTEMLIQTRI